MYVYTYIYTYIYTCIMLFDALKCNCTYIDVYLVIAVIPGVGMYVNTCIYHVLSQQVDSRKTTRLNLMNWLECVLRYTWNEYTHSFSKDTSNEYTRSFCHGRHMNRNKCNAYSHSLTTHWDAYTYVYSVLPANRMRLCVHTSMYTIGFLQVVPHTQCFDKPIMCRFEVLCPSHHEYWSSFTLCLAPHSHCATFSLAPCCVPRSHRVVEICVAPA